MNWKSTQVASEGTHHLRDGNPLYSKRFHEVLKFHEPGLAPVVDGSGAYHIDLGGAQAYPERYQRTFGFYGGMAAVCSTTGWKHIHVDGKAVYAQPYAWCGNFQGGLCTVRSLDGRYFHILKDGNRAYQGSWCYAGDFRDGLATVQGSNGLYSHIDGSGQLIHGEWFLDLDAFTRDLPVGEMPRVGLTLTCMERPSTNAVSHW